MRNNLEESYSKSNWYKTGIVWGILMFILTLSYQLVFGEKTFIFPDSIMTLLIWLAGGLGYGYGMHLYFQIRKRKQKQTR
jgi:hypothetical protein